MGSSLSSRIPILNSGERSNSLAAEDLAELRSVALQHTISYVTTAGQLGMQTRPESIYTAVHLNELHIMAQQQASVADETLAAPKRDVQSQQLAARVITAETADEQPTAPVAAPNYTIAELDFMAKAEAVSAELVNRG